MTFPLAPELRQRAEELVKKYPGAGFWIDAFKSILDEQSPQGVAFARFLDAVSGKR